MAEGVPVTCLHRHKPQRRNNSRLGKGPVCKLKAKQVRFLLVLRVSLVCLLVRHRTRSLSVHHSKRITYVMPRPKTTIKLNQANFSCPLTWLKRALSFILQLQKNELLAKLSEPDSILRSPLVFPHACQKYSNQRENMLAHIFDRRQKNGNVYRNVLDRVLHLQSFLLFILRYWDNNLSPLMYEILYLENALANLL